MSEQLDSSLRPPARGSSAPPGLDLLVVWRSLRKYWTTACGTALAILLCVTFYTLGQTKIYQASATVQFDPTPPRPLGKSVDMVVDIGAGAYWNNQEYYETQYKIIKSRRVAISVVKRFGLNMDAAFLANAPPAEKPAAREVSVEDAAEILRARIKVEPVKESRLATVTYEDADPDRARRILSALMDAYIEQNLDYAQASTNSAVEWLRQQVDKLRGELESSERALHQYKLDKNILSLDPDAQSNMLREEMKQLNDELTSVRAKREEISARRNELSKIKAEDPRELPDRELLSSATIQQLRQKYEEALQDRAAMAGAGKGGSHPDVAAIQRRVETSRAALLAEVRNVQRAVDRELAAASSQEKGLSRLFEASKRRALDLNLLEVDYNRLRRARDNNEKLYSLVLDRTKESDLARMMSVNNIRLLDQPLLPRAPVKPRVPLNIAFGLFVGIALGVGGAMARALLDRTVKTPDELEEIGLPFLGLIPEIGETTARGPYYARRRNRAKDKPPQNLELIVHEAPASGVAEAARSIRTNLMFMAPDEPHRTLLVTSPAPAEGKTTVAVSIAIAMAQAGQRVLLLDCDLRRPRVHRIFHKTNDLGVTSALLEGMQAHDVAFQSEVPNLWVVPAGPIPPNPAELFHSERFRAFLRSAQERFDRIIIDSPPVVTVTDAAVLSTLVDGVVLVVRAFATTKELTRHAARALRDVGGKTVGAVLNAVNLNRHEYKYHYYYYRRDEYYAQGGSERAAQSPKDHAA